MTEIAPTLPAPADRTWLTAYELVLGTKNTDRKAVKASTTMKPNHTKFLRSDSLLIVGALAGPAAGAAVWVLAPGRIPGSKWVQLPVGVPPGRAPSLVECVSGNPLDPSPRLCCDHPFGHGAVTGVGPLFCVRWPRAALRTHTTVCQMLVLAGADWPS